MSINLFTEASIVGTLPHFYGADEKYQRQIDGIYPDEGKHIITMDVEPLTGTPLRGGKKLQLNMFLRQIDQIREL
jgi:lysosome membrane protein 2